MRLIFTPSLLREAMAMLMVMCRFCSSGSVSRMLVPSSTLPIRVVAPTAWRRDSTRLVLPDPPWPTTATFLIFVGSGDAITTLPSARCVGSIPRENIQRAIDRATGGGEAAALESVVYEGYAPGGVSVMVEAATDNRNRTA